MPLTNALGSVTDWVYCNATPSPAPTGANQPCEASTQTTHIFSSSHVLVGAAMSPATSSNTTYNWTDGTPVASGSGSNIDYTTQGNQVQLQLVSGTAEKVATFYVAAACSAVKVQASMNGVTITTPNIAVDTTGETDRYFTVTFKSAAASTLTVYAIPNGVQSSCTPAWGTAGVSFVGGVASLTSNVASPAPYAFVSPTPSPEPTTAYDTTVLADTPTLEYPFSENNAATSAIDLSGNTNNALYSGTVTLGQSSLLLSDASTGVLFDGSSGFAGSNSSVPTLGTTLAQTILAYEKQTSTSAGGSLIGFDQSVHSTTGSRGLTLFETDAGKFSLFAFDGTGSLYQITTTGTYNDGNPHFVAGEATLSSAASGSSLVLTIYVANTSGTLTTTTQTFTTSHAWSTNAQYLVVGGQSLSGVTGTPASNFFGGTIQKAAQFPSALTTSQLNAILSAAGY